MGTVVVAAAVVRPDLRPEDCLLPVLLEALAEVVVIVEVKEANHILEAPLQQMLLKIVPLDRDNKFLSPSIFQSFFVLLQTRFSFLAFSLSCS